MLFLWFPINTDAPVYHFPWATLSLIVANTLVFAGILTGHVSVDAWTLTYRHIAPLEWITSNFVHGGLWHLLGNMFFLWSVGLIVEGKLGWRWFTVVYFAIGITQCAIEQVCMLGAEGGSLGASSIVFGLTAIALVWAPKNEISFAWFVWFLILIRAGVAELTVLTYSAFVMTFELLVFGLQGFEIGTSALHLMGAVLGYGIGVMILKRGLVDCEGWDLFSVMKGQHGRVAGDPANVSLGLFGARRSRRRRKRKPSRMLTDSADDVPAGIVEDDPSVSRTERTRRKLLRYIAEGKPQAAINALRQFQHTQPAFRLDRQPLRNLAQGLIDHEQWNDAVALLEEYLERFDHQSDAIRLQLALILLQKQRRPRAAQHVLKEIDPQQLSTKLRRRLSQAEQTAREMIDSGVIELSGQPFPSR